MVVIIYEPED